MIDFLEEICPVCKTSGVVSGKLHGLRHCRKCNANWNAHKRVEQTVEVGIGFFDEEEIHHNCTVTVWRNSRTGEVSIGWKEDNDGTV